MQGMLNGLAATVMAAWLALPAQAASVQSLYSFGGGADGSQPTGRLAVDGAGLLYGTTLGGGSAQRGTIYKFDPATGVLATLHSFADDANGSQPEGGLVLDNSGHLYGVTARSGQTAFCSLGCGTVFRYTIGTGKLTTLHQFTGLADGSTPQGAVLLVKGVLYGTASYGGTGASCPTQGCGTVFRFSTVTKAFSVIRELTVADGADPLGKLVRAANGLLYGTLTSGGPNGSGTVFSVDPASSAFTVVHGFDYHVDGGGLTCDLVTRNGQLFGTTMAGGASPSGQGTIFTLNPTSGAITSQLSLAPPQGGMPQYGVAFGANGILYGTTNGGGASGAGTAFKYNPATGVFTPIHDFTIADGSQPSAPLVLGKSGVLYGVTSGGGGGAGTIFKIVP